MNDAFDDILVLLRKVINEVEGVAVRTARLEQATPIPPDIEPAVMQAERKRLGRLRGELDTLVERVQRLKQRNY